MALFSRMLSALLSMKLSPSPVVCLGATLGCLGGSAAKLFFWLALLVGNFMATFRVCDRRPLFRGVTDSSESESTLWSTQCICLSTHSEMCFSVYSSHHCIVTLSSYINTKKHTMALISLLKAFSNPLRDSPSELASNTLALSATFLASLKLLFCGKWKHNLQLASSTNN